MHLTTGIYDENGYISRPFFILHLIQKERDACCWFEYSIRSGGVNAIIHDKMHNKK